MKKLIINTWDTKLWWVHSEVLYTSLLFSIVNDDHECADIYTKICNYVFNTFPNPNKKIGEWIQIRNRKGKPL